MTMVLESPRAAVAEIADFVARLAPEDIAPARAAELFEAFAELTRLGSAAQVLLAPLVAESDTWRRAGHGSAASWMARATGTPTGDAVATLETAERLESLPRTEAALRRGALSVPQLHAITSAATTDPAAEVELLDVAGTCGLEGLRGFCRQVKAVAGSAAAEMERYESVRRARFLHHRSGPDGAVRGEFSLAPDAGARFLASLEARAGELVAAARRGGRRDSVSACAADALVDLVTRGAGPATTPEGAHPLGATATSHDSGTTIVHLHVDATALRRGHVERGEVCEIPGVGPVPVATARALIPGSFFELLVADGFDVVSVCHAGWGVPEHVRDALVGRDPRCVVPECHVAWDLEIVQVDTPEADGEPMALARLARVCAYHDALKTYEGYTLTGGPVRWEWNPPSELDTG